MDSGGDIIVGLDQQYLSALEVEHVWWNECVLLLGYYPELPFRIQAKTLAVENFYVSLFSHSYLHISCMHYSLASSVVGYEIYPGIEGLALSSSHWRWRA